MEDLAQVKLELPLRRGFLQIPFQSHQHYLGGCEVVAFLWCDPWVECIPLHNEAVGGFLLKVCNRDGDRAVDLRGFLRECMLGDPADQVLLFSWNADHVAWRTRWGPGPADKR